MPGVFRIPASHRRVVMPSRTIRFGTHGVPTRAPAALRRGPVPKQRLKYPSDGLIRAHASAASRERTLWRSDRIERFDRVSRLYCELALGYRDLYVREEFIYLELKRKIQMRKQARQSVTQEDLLPLIRLIVGEIEANLLDLAEHRGRRLAEPTPHGHTVVMATIGQKTGRKCFLILEPRQDTFVVKSLKTSAAYAASVRKQISRKNREDYRNARLQRALKLH
jgi:hypothetical protein